MIQHDLTECMNISGAERKASEILENWNREK